VVEITVLVRGSMCETVSWMKFAAHTAPSAKAMNVTSGPDCDRPRRRMRSRLDAPDGSVIRLSCPHRSVAHGDPREAAGGTEMV
jgi:hypothetical protein